MFCDISYELADRTEIALELLKSQFEATWWNRSNGSQLNAQWGNQNSKNRKQQKPRCRKPGMMNWSEDGARNL
jgi:hypothetical protein